jgi:cell wall-associated NlpC family hydrolase
MMAGETALSSADDTGVCIGADSLLPADILVSTTSAFVSGAIRKLTGSNISHASVYTGTGQVIEAIGEGVVKRPLDTAVAEATLAVAFRRRDMTAGGAEQVISFVESKVGKKYDYVGVAGAGIARNKWVCISFGLLTCYVAKRGVLSSGNKFYCSELVLEAYDQANMPLVSGRTDTSTPEDIVQAYLSHLIEYVGHLVG